MVNQNLQLQRLLIPSHNRNFTILVLCDLTTSCRGNAGFHILVTEPFTRSIILFAVLDYYNKIFYLEVDRKCNTKNDIDSANLHKRLFVSAKQFFCPKSVKLILTKKDILLSKRHGFCSVWNALSATFSQISTWSVTLTFVCQSWFARGKKGESYMREMLAKLAKAFCGIKGRFVPTSHLKQK